MFLTQVIWGLIVPEAVRAGMSGGSYRPLKDRDLNGFIIAALEILATIGLAGATSGMIELACEKGCQVSDA